MSKCDLRFELDRSPPHYHPGETVRGKLRVEVNAQCRCDNLSVTLQWRTHGRGNKDRGTPKTEPLGAFDWIPGESVHDFSFLMPHGPVTYHGHLVNVDWYLLARADVPWAVDPKAEQDIVLLPAPAQSRAASDYRSGPQREAVPHVIGAPSRTQKPWTRIAGVAAVIVLLAVFFGRQLFVDDQPNWPMIAFFAVVLFATGRMVWKDLRNLAAQQKVGNLAIETTPPTATRGEPLEVRALLVPRGNGRINRVGAALVGREIAVSGSGTRRTTHTHSLERVDAEMAQSMTITGEQRVELACTLHVPDNAPPTFRAPSNQVVWQVEVHVDIAGWPDLEATEEIALHPS